mgnify:CR=1 FL=1
MRISVMMNFKYLSTAFFITLLLHVCVKVSFKLLQDNSRTQSCCRLYCWLKWFTKERNYWVVYAGMRSITTWITYKWTNFRITIFRRLLISAVFWKQIRISIMNSKKGDPLLICVGNEPNPMTLFMNFFPSNQFKKGNRNMMELHSKMNLLFTSLAYESEYAEVAGSSSTERERKFVRFSLFHNASYLYLIE